MNNIMRIALIGPGDVKFHYQELLKIPKAEFQAEIEKIAKALAKSRSEIELLPDNGICIEIAKLYKKYKGKKVVGSIPKSDKIFGVSHLEQYVKAEVNGKPLFDELIDTENWFKHDLIKGLMGNAILYLGASPGTDGERHYAVYLYKLIAGFKKGVNVNSSSIHPQAMAGRDFTIFVYTPFLLAGKLPKEDKAYMEKFGVNLVYVNSASDLEKKLKITNPSPSSSR